jgi:tRNA(Glu) U13 pseudouridine synthase TruD
MSSSEEGFNTLTTKSTEANGNLAATAFHNATNNDSGAVSIVFEFSLSAGAFATALLRELTNNDSFF